MKKLSIFLMMLMAFCVPLVAFADELTIANGTSANNSYVPMYTYYCDFGFKSEYIIPASQLTNLPSGSEITAITLYQASSAAWVAKNLTIKLSNTTSTSYSSTGLLGSSGTTVYTNSSYSANSATSHTFTFNGSSFTYSGGSLIVQISAESGGTYKSSTWYGVSQTTNQGYYVYGSSSSSGSLQKFIPKTTFVYTPTSGSCANGCECFENCTALTSTSAGGSGSTPAANLPSNWKGYGASYYPFTAQFTSYMGSDAEGNFMYFKASTDNACFLALPYQYVTEVNFDYAYETDAYDNKLTFEIGYMTDISSSTWYNNTFHSIKTMTNNGATWDSETVDFSSVTGTFYVVFKFSQTQGSWYSAAIDNVCVTTNAPDPCDKTIPYTYGFEDASDFSCWTTEDCETDQTQNYSGIVSATNNEPAHSGSKMFSISSYDGTVIPQYLISPKLRGVVNGVHVEFYYKNVYYSTAPETFQVGYSTTDNNVSSFTWVDSKTSESNTFQHFTANYMGKVKYIAVKYTAQNSYYLLLDDFSFSEAPSCLEPTNVTASNETTTSATISWTAGGSETIWDLYYTTSSTEPTSSTTPSISGISSTSQNLTGLTPATTYYVYVRSSCSGSDKSEWSEVCIFNTECNGMSLPYTETFESGALTVCWNIINDSPVYMNAEVATTASYAGTYHLSLRRGTSDGNQIVVLPEVASNYALSNYVVSFYARLYASSSNETTTNRSLAVGVMTDPDDASTFVQVGSAVTPTASYAQYTFDLSSYTGNGHYIAIKHTSTSNGHTFIDNIEVNALPCPVPAGLSATPASTTASLSWTGDQSSYNVRYRSYTQGEPQENVFEEGFEGGSMPSGWDNSIYTGSSWNVGAGTGHTNSGITATSTSATGSYNAYYYNNTYSNYAYLILPALDLSNATAATLTFNYVNPAWAGGYYALTVYYRVNSGAWNELAKYTTSQDTWTGKTVTLTGFDSNYEVAFYVTGYNSDYGHGVGIDDVKITYTAQSTTYGAWNTSNTNVTSPLTITGLTPTTDYEWQVQGLNCDGNGGTTDWSASATFTTLEGYTKHIEPYTSDGGYYLIASPLVNNVAPTDVTGMITDNLGANVDETTSTYDLYSFDQAQELEWRNYRASNFSLVNGQGYLYASKEGTELVFTGAGNTGNTQDVTLYMTAEASGLDFPDWNLVGNPFAKDNAYLSDGRAFYSMQNSGVYTPQHGPVAIGPMEGVFVVANSNEETLTFTTTQPNKKVAQLTLNLTKSASAGSTLLDRAIVSFDEGSQLPKLQFRNGSTKVYMPMDGKEYAIVSAEAMGTMPVNFKAENNGTYTLSFTAEEVSFAYLHLIDNMNGNDVDLLANPSYTFEAKTTDYESRFKLVFAAGNSNDDNFAFYSNGSFVINNEGNATLQVIDVNGRILKSESINGCANVNVNAAQGIYMLRLVNGNDVKVQKVVVR